MTVQVNHPWALVPVKPFGAAKSRLSDVLSQRARVTLAERLLTGVIARLTHSGAIDRTYVLTSDPTVADLSASLGAEVIADGKLAPLNVIIDGGLHRLEAAGAPAVIVVMSDLPCLEARDIMALAARAAIAGVTIGPDTFSRGTNALALRPPTCMPTCFGSETSFIDHVRRARASGLPAATYWSSGVSTDIDTPDDLRRWQARTG